MLRESSLDEYIEYLRETYTRVSPEAWHAFRDQVIAIGERYDPENNTITVRVARRDVRSATLN